MKNVMMELRPCLEGYAGIPQDTRLTYEILSRNKDINLGGLILDNTPGTTGFPIKRAKSASDHFDIVSRYIIALEEGGDISRSRLSRYLGKFAMLMSSPGQYTANQLGMNRGLLDINPAYFSDYLWQRLFNKSLPIEARENVLSTKFFGTSISWPQMARCAVYNLPYMHLSTNKWDVFVAQTPFVGKVSKKTQLVVRYHDAIPLTHPHTIHTRKIHQRVHYNALKKNSRHALFVCNSTATKNVLLNMFPNLSGRTTVIPCCVPNIFYNDTEISLNTIILNRFNFECLPGLSRFRDISLFKDKLLASIHDEYFIAVGTLEPRKNYLAIISAWEKFRSNCGKDIKLILVANLGWDNKKELERLTPHLLSGNAYILKNVPLYELRKLYSNAIACLAASYAEGFSYSGIEAMKCGTPVIASDIDCHRDVYKDAALFFDPFVPNQLSARMHDIAELDSNDRVELLKKGEEVSNIYSEENSAKLWSEFLVNL